MPTTKHYNVVQTREVEVMATSATDAIRIASSAFEHGQNSERGVAEGKAPEGVWGNTTKQIVETELSATQYD